MWCVCFEEGEGKNDHLMLLNKASDRLLPGLSHFLSQKQGSHQQKPIELWFAWDSERLSLCMFVKEFIFETLLLVVALSFFGL